VIDQTRAEFLKLRSTRTSFGLVAGMVTLVLLFALLTGLLTKAAHLTTVENERGVLGVGSIAGVFSALVGVLLVTSEYRFGTIKPTFLFTPVRSRVLAAKTMASLAAGICFGIVGEAVGFGVGYACLAGRGIPMLLSGGEIALLVGGSVAGVALWAAIGVGVGAIVRNQVATVVGLLAWGFIVENLLFAFVPSVGRFTPGEAQNALSGLTTNHLLSPLSGAAMLVAWCAALGLAGIALTNRRDVS
jgi:hypothetical protein